MTNKTADFMNKVKIALTILSIAIVIGPLIGVAYVYRDNLLGLVVPPQVKSLMSGDSTGSNLQMPTLVGEPQYNAQTGALTVSFNFTNSLTNRVSIDKLSADVQSEEDGISLGNISLSQPIQITSGETSTINVSGLLNQAAISQFEAQNPGVNGINISLENVNADVAGINVHMNQVNNVGQLQLQG
ncbi:MAG: hypothetical protein ABSA75_10605 [Candidatus Bathyarchaeia archaeon]|jgi:hypothetical protein